MGRPVFCHLLLYTESCRALLGWTAGAAVTTCSFRFCQRPSPPPPEMARAARSGVSQRADRRTRPPHSCGFCLETSGNLVKLDQSAASPVQTNAVAFGDRLLGNWGASQIRNVQRSSCSGFTCQCGASETDSAEVRIPSPLWSSDLGRMNRTSTGGTNFTHGATGVVWLTGVSISLNAVSG